MGSSTALSDSASQLIADASTIINLIATRKPSMSDTDAVFRALADRNRRMLLDRLNANDGQTLTELCTHLDVTRQAVTQHLSVLEAANLVVTIWRGREKLHFVNPVPLQEIYDRWICKFERSRLRAMRDLKRRLEGTKSA
jgi:DNA-binding transcriptional ArsR family regulator